MARRGRDAWTEEGVAAACDPTWAADSDEAEAEWADGHRKAILGLHVGRTRDLRRQQTTSCGKARR